MFNILDLLTDDVMEKIKIWHVLVGLFSIIILSCIFVVVLFLSIPKYNTYLQMEEMRREILWAETHEKAALQIGPVLKEYPEYSEYMLYKHSDDLDSLEITNIKP